MRVAVTVEIIETSGERCDQLMSHLLRASFGPEAIAEVTRRFSQLFDVTPVGSLPQQARGLVETTYLVVAERPALDGSIAGIVDQ